MQVREFAHPKAVYSQMIGLVVSLAECGLIHGDFNEFNLMADEEERITMIDFPQMVSTDHYNAAELFDRDVEGVQAYFRKKFGLTFAERPRLEVDVDKKEDLDKQVRASGFLREEIGEERDVEEGMQLLFEAIEEDKHADEEGE